jgi:hypothetical protein
VPNEPLPREPAVDPAVLKLVTTHPFFANAPPLLVLAWNAEGLDTWTHGAGEKHLQTSIVSASARWLRSGLAEFKETNTVMVVGQRAESVGKTISVSAANGLVTLAAKTVITSGGKTSSTFGDKTVALEQMQGSIFPAEVGKKFSYLERHAGTSSLPGGNSNFSVERSCEYVDKRDASELHPRLRGTLQSARRPITSA